MGGGNWKCSEAFCYTTISPKLHIPPILFLSLHCIRYPTNLRNYYVLHFLILSVIKRSNKSHIVSENLKRPERATRPIIWQAICSGGIQRACAVWLKNKTVANTPSVWSRHSLPRWLQGMIYLRQGSKRQRGLIYRGSTWRKSFPVWIPLKEKELPNSTL